MVDWILHHEYKSAEGIVRYGVEGAGENVVLVHGTPWSSFTWHHLVPILSKSYRVHYYDFIGYGQSEKSSSQNVSLDVQGRLLADLLVHWDLEAPHVIAHDLGGATSLRAHLLHECEYSSLQLINVVALSPWGSEFFNHVMEHEKAFAGMPRYIHEAIVRAYISGALYQGLEKYEIDQLVQPWISEGGQSAFYRQMVQADRKYTDDVEHLYSRMRCPVSILWGEKDPWIPVEMGLRLQSEIVGSSFGIISLAGHLSPLERPACINKKLLAFLSV